MKRTFLFLFAAFVLVLFSQVTQAQVSVTVHVGRPGYYVPYYVPYSPVIVTPGYYPPPPPPPPRHHYRPAPPPPPPHHHHHPAPPPPPPHHHHHR